MSETNGPTKDEFNDALADFESLRLEQMAIMARQARVMEQWEKKGGDRDDLRDGFKLSQLDEADRQREVKRRQRVHGWMGIVIVEDDGQVSFAPTFEVPTQTGAGGAELGSRLSLVRAKTDGFNSGKHREGALSQNPWPADTEEALEWASGYGAGAEYRKPPKPTKEASEADGEANDEATPKRGRKARAVPETAAESDKPGWQAERDFHDETAEPVH